MDHVLKTRNRYLSEARRAEEAAKLMQSDKERDNLLDETVWKRVLASLPSYSRAS